MARELKARSSKISRTDFSRFVDTLPSSGKILGLTHITSSYVLRDMIESGKVEAPEKCTVLQENLVYAFYGRSAYRYKDSMNPTSLSSLFPSVLILDPRKVPKPKYVFGFDSGAFYNNAMDQHLHPYMPLFDFLLTPDIISASRLVEAVFLNDDDFFQNRINPNFKVPSGNFEAESYHSIVKSGGQGNIRLDDRLSTPEIVFADAIDLKACVRAAILPDTLSQHSDIGGTLRSLGIRVDDYPWSTCSRPGENHYLVQTMVRSIYKDFGWL